MALETLADVTEIEGFSVVHMDTLRESHPEMFRPDGSMHYHLFERDIRPTNFIYVRGDVNSISFTLQKGPIKEVGVNGCQVDTLIAAAKVIIHRLDEKFPCLENEEAEHHLGMALQALSRRKANREARGVEGRNEP